MLPRRPKSPLNERRKLTFELDEKPGAPHWDELMPWNWHPADAEQIAQAA